MYGYREREEKEPYVCLSDFDYTAIIEGIKSVRDKNWNFRSLHFHLHTLHYTYMFVHVTKRDIEIHISMNRNNFRTLPSTPSRMNEWHAD
jgi:hypothetical protein